MKFFREYSKRCKVNYFSVKRSSCIALFCIIQGMLFSPDIVRSQEIAQKVYQKYAPSIVKRVYDMNTALDITLSETSQLVLADLYAQEDNLIAAYIQKHANDTALVGNYADSIHNRIVYIDFKNQLSPAGQKVFTGMEYNMDAPLPVIDDRVLSRVDMQSLSGEALWYKDLIHISKPQSDSLLQAVHELYVQEDLNPSFDKEASDKNLVAKILTKEQFLKLWTIKNQRADRKKPMMDWNVLEKSGYAKFYDKTKTLRELTDYYMARAAIQAWMSIDWKKYDSLISSFDKEDKAEAFIVAGLVRGGYPQRVIKKAVQLKTSLCAGNFGDILKLCDTLRLTDAQIDTLVKTGKGKQTNYNTKYVSILGLYSVLNDEQLSSFTTIKYGDQIELWADRTWKEMIERGMNKDSSLKEQVVRPALKEYYLQTEMIHLRYANQPQVMNQLTSELKTKEPPALAKLEELRGVFGANRGGYTW